MNTSQEITALRKEGKIDEAYAKAKAWVEKNDHPWGAQNSMAWVLDSKIKNALSSADKINDEVAGQVESLLYEYAALKEVTRPSIVHSVILGRILKVFEHWEGFIRFIKWWDIRNFREEDFESQRFGKKTIDSLYARFARAFAKAALASNQRGDLTLEDRVYVMQVCEECAKKLPNDEWLPYFYGKFLVDDGNLEKAQPFLLSAAKFRPREWWVWTKLAESFRHRDAEKARICYAFGLSLAEDPKMARPYRIDFAEHLASMEHYPEAAVQTRLAKQASDAQSQSPGSKLQHLMDSDWFKASEGKTLPDPESCEDEALGLLFTDLPSVIGVIDNHNKKKGLAHLSYADKRDGVLHYKTHPKLAELPKGTVVEAWFSEHSHQPMRVMPQEERVEIPKFLAIVEGEIRKKKDQSFAFISGKQDAFLPPDLVSGHGIEDKQKRKVYAVYAKKPNAETRSWRALQVLEG